MDIALANILFRACGNDPHPNVTMRQQGCHDGHAALIVREFDIEYGIRLDASRVLDMTPNQLQSEVG